MKILVHAAPTTLEAHRHPNLGVLSSPRRYYRDVEGWPWAADNDAFSKWDPGRYREMVSVLKTLDGALFVTAPDVVGDWEDTHDRFEEWAPELAGLPIAYVLQDGQPHDWVPWQHIHALFVGGSDEFKMGAPAAALVREARWRGLWVHMGRVNGHRRLRYAKALGCDSVDGTSFSWFRDRWLQVFLDHAAAPVQLLIDNEDRGLGLGKNGWPGESASAGVDQESQPAPVATNQLRLVEDP